MSSVSSTSGAVTEKFVYSDQGEDLNRAVEKVFKQFNLKNCYIPREKDRVLASRRFFAELPEIVDYFAVFVFTGITGSVNKSMGYSHRLPTKLRPLIREYSLNIRNINTGILEVLNDASIIPKKTILKKWLTAVNSYKKPGPQDCPLPINEKIKMADVVEPNYTEFNAHLAKMGEATVEKLNRVFEAFRSTEGNEGFQYHVEFIATAERTYSISADVSTSSSSVSSLEASTDDLDDLMTTINMLRVSAYYQPTQRAIELAKSLSTEAASSSSSSSSKKPSYEDVP